DGSQVANFRRGFIRRSGERSVNAFEQSNPGILAGGFEFLSQGEVVNFRLIHEPRSPAVFVGSEKRIYTLKVDMVRNDHQIAPGKGRIDGTRSVGQDEGLRAETADNAGAEGDFSHRVAFVVV